MASNNVIIRLEVPYEEIKEKVNISSEELKKQYGSRIQKELADFLSHTLDSDLTIERYYQVCLILSNIRIYNWKMSKKVDPGQYSQINRMALSGSAFENILKEVNAYFLRSTSALEKKDFDVEKDFILYYNSRP